LKKSLNFWLETELTWMRQMWKEKLLLIWLLNAETKAVLNSWHSLKINSRNSYWTSYIFAKPDIFYDFFCHNLNLSKNIT
jgi:hypothetical protein